MHLFFSFAICSKVFYLSVMEAHKKDKFVVANWKMNKTLKETKEFMDKFKKLIRRDVLRRVGVAIAPPFTCLHALKLPKGISLAAQDMFWEEKGAFTGEISPVQLLEFKVEYVILGHSERRRYMKEDDEMVSKKVSSAIENSIVPIMCIGETLEERRSGRMKAVLERQIVQGLPVEMLREKDSLVIAYEPVWAIGTGIPATPDDIVDAHGFVEGVLDSMGITGVKIIYGGSVDPKVAREISPICSGSLVGGASLRPELFWEIIEGFL